MCKTQQLVFLVPLHLLSVGKRKDGNMPSVSAFLEYVTGKKMKMSEYLQKKQSWSV